MYFVRTPIFANFIFPNLVWNIPTRDKIIFITFDDGPNPKSTVKILEILNLFNAKATFFCTGKKVEMNKDLYQQILNEGHAVGNHSYHHYKNLNTKSATLIEDVRKCSELVNSRLFRPPYGKISKDQLKMLKKEYKIIMWSILPGDFDHKVSKEKLLKRSLKYSKRGTIIVFHDQSKILDKIEFVLPEYLKHFTEKGYEFKAINESELP